MDLSNKKFNPYKLILKIVTFENLIKLEGVLLEGVIGVFYGT
jgi:hypothetical protein